MWKKRSNDAVPVTSNRTLFLPHPNARKATSGERQNLNSRSCQKATVDGNGGSGDEAGALVVQQPADAAEQLFGFTKPF